MLFISFVHSFVFFKLSQCMVIALSLHHCLNGASAEESDHEDESDDGNTLGAVTQHTGATVLGVLLSSGESLVNEAEAAITNSNTIHLHFSIQI